MREIENNYENLSDRKKVILMGAVEDYIANASPITSGAVHKHVLKNISPATLRNELNALEAMGYLKQLHTSGGRVPTSKAYRLYVNNIMGEVSFEVENLTAVKSLLEQKTINLNDIVSKLSDCIAEATNYPAVVMLNGVNKLVLKNIRIIPLITGQVLVLLQTSAGIINNTIDINSDITEQNCIDASNLLTRNFKNKTIEEMVTNINSIENDMKQEIDEFKNLIYCLIDSLSEFAKEKKMNISSTTKLLSQPEYSTVEKAKEIFDLFEDESVVEQILEEGTDENNISFKIGKENENEKLNECSVVQANFKVSEESSLSIGVIGPERMDYGKIASALKYVIDEIKTIKNLDYKKDGNEK